MSSSMTRGVRASHIRNSLSAGHLCRYQPHLPFPSNRPLVFQIFLIFFRPLRPHKRPFGQWAYFPRKCPQRVLSQIKKTQGLICPWVCCHMVHFFRWLFSGGFDSIDTLYIYNRRESDRSGHSGSAAASGTLLPLEPAAAFLLSFYCRVPYPFRVGVYYPIAAALCPAASSQDQRTPCPCTSISLCRDRRGETRVKRKGPQFISRGHSSIYKCTL